MSRRDLTSFGRAVTVTFSLVMLLTGQALACACDCDASGETTIDEILSGVNIALGTRQLADCRPCDVDAGGSVDVDEVIAAISAALTGCPIEPTSTPTPTVTQPLATATLTTTPTSGATIAPIFPASYRNTYLEVRECRSSVEHGGVAIRVLANPTAAEPYRQELSPLPVGSVVVKEEYDDSDCSDDTKLIRWRAMRKEAPGFDVDDGDWHWQWVNRDRRVLFDDKSTCIGCHTAPACFLRDLMCTVDTDRPKVPPMAYVFDGIQGALLSAAGTSASNVFVVGADPKDGLGPYVLHYNGSCWARLRTGASGALWWVSFTPISGALYMVGEDGLILRYDLTSGEFERQQTPGGATLFGVWGETAASIWAVGRNETNAAGVLWHFDGTSWSPFDLSAIFPEATPVIFKIWGRTERDIYAVGQAGTILHYDGERWAKIPSATNRPLFTVHGNQDIVVATGGFGTGVVVENDGDGFVDRSPAFADQVNGVCVPPSGAAIGVGVGASVVARSTHSWQVVPTDLDTRNDFHAVWIDPDGGVWAVGGDLSVDLTEGKLAYGGSRHIPTEIHLDQCGGERD